eukprot:COSAG05_NODE_1916_length_3838_cov_2.914951_2_plen_64_part_00
MVTGVFEDTDKLAPFMHFTKHTRQALELARGSQYSTRPASASHTFSTKLQLGKKEKKIKIDFR